MESLVDVATLRLDILSPTTSSAVTNLTDCHTAQFRLHPDPTQTDHLNIACDRALG